MRTRLLLTGTVLMSMGLRVQAQDPQLSQFYAAPMYLNPALTGNTFQDRIALNYRIQWPGIAPGYETYAVAYDHNNAKAHSGYGFMVMHDEAGSNSLAFTHIGASYSYEARINHSNAIRFGMRLGYTTRQFDMGSFLFADQVIRDGAPTTLEPVLVQRTSYFDASMGAMYYGEHVWLGASFSHINRPQQTLLVSGDTRLPVRTSIHTGYRIAMDDRSMARTKSTFNIAAHYKAQQDWDQLDLGVYIDHNPLMAGLWYRGLPGVKAYEPGYPNHDAVILMAGFQTQKQLRIIYSYDITISWQGVKTGGAHEISLTYEWPARHKNRKFHMVPCPKF
ncbi:MAG: PorP/SprF family type IX secretion system membrane protein [Flavobacteriales bacterium]|nr:PorP/SprF family type IX secretion system membrane protein [Flavobacteriales bacterium]